MARHMDSTGPSSQLFFPHRPDLSKFGERPVTSPQASSIRPLPLGGAVLEPPGRMREPKTPGTDPEALPKVPPGGLPLSPALAIILIPEPLFLLKIYQKSLSIFNLVFYWFLDPLGLPKPSPDHFEIVQILFWDRLHIENVDFHEIIEKPMENQ